MQKTKSKRCALDTCNKKISISNEYECRCNLFFCPLHKFSKDHNCTYDYKKDQQDKLEKANPKICAKKLDKI